MSLNGDVIGHLAELFRGRRDAHGLFFPTHVEGKKQKGRSTTERGSVTDALWNSHLKGEAGLGVIPINEESRCKWAAIDIDDFDINFVELLEMIRNTPFVCCQSKSGGAHLYLFIRDYVDPRIVRDYLRTMVSNFGLGSCEIFPKQESVQTERGDVGNWINMPYFGDKRKAIIGSGGDIHELSLKEFIEYAEEKAVHTGFFDEAPQFNYDESPLEGGPPCLQVMTIKGFPPHTRNISLFNIGIYCKRAMPDQWKLVLRKFNVEFFNDSGGKLSEREVEEIIKSLDKREYSYQCYEAPLCTYCNSKLCRTRKFGISAIVGLPIVNSITKVVGDTSIWFLDVEGGRLELTTEELYDNRKFTMRCLNDLSILPNRMKPDKWTAFVQTLVDQAIEIRDEQMFERDTTPEHFKSFIVTRLAKSPNDIEANRTWYDKENSEIRFKFDAFLNFLKFKRVNLPKASVIMYFKSRACRQGVGKDKLRRSYRYFSVKLTTEELAMVEMKQKGDEIL